MVDSQSINSYDEKRKRRGKERLVEVLDFNFEIHLHYLKPRIISLKGVGKKMRLLLFGRILR
mgnify:FL=1